MRAAIRRRVRDAAVLVQQWWRGHGDIVPGWTCTPALPLAVSSDHRPGPRPPRGPARPVSVPRACRARLGGRDRHRPGTDPARPGPAPAAGARPRRAVARRGLARRGSPGRRGPGAGWWTKPSTRPGRCTRPTPWSSSTAAGWCSSATTACSPNGTSPASRWARRPRCSRGRWPSPCSMPSSGCWSTRGGWCRVHGPPCPSGRARATRAGGSPCEHLLAMRDGLQFAEEYVEAEASDVIQMLFGTRPGGHGQVRRRPSAGGARQAPGSTIRAGRVS